MSLVLNWGDGTLGSPVDGIIRWGRSIEPLDSVSLPEILLVDVVDLLLGEEAIPIEEVVHLFVVAAELLLHEDLVDIQLETKVTSKTANERGNRERATQP